MLELGAVGMASVPNFGFSGPSLASFRVSVTEPLSLENYRAQGMLGFPTSLIQADTLSNNSSNILA